MTEDELVDACVEQLREVYAYHTTMPHTLVFGAQRVAYVDTWFVRNTAGMSRAVTIAALLNLLVKTGGTKAQKAMEAICERDPPPASSQFGVFINTEKGVSFLDELFQAAWPPRDHTAFDLLQAFMSDTDKRLSVLRVHVDLHFPDVLPQPQTLATVRSIADIFNRRDPLQLSLK